MPDRGTDAAPLHHQDGTVGRRRALAAQARRAGEAAVQRLADQRAAAAQAAQDRARAIALSAQARDAADRLRDTETRAVDTLSRIETLGARRQALQDDLARQSTTLARMLPLIERLSLYPAETLLASPAKPEDALTGLMVLRGLGTQISSRAQAIRVRQLDLARLSASLEAQGHGLVALTQEQAARGQAVALQAERAAAAQRASQAAADAASRQAAASAARAASLQDAVARIEAAQREAESRFQQQATAAEHASRPDVARTARADAASVSFGAGPGLAPGPAAAPVAGRLVQGWGASTDAGPATGVTYAPPALAAVSAPCDGRIDFAGPFRSYGKMLILDCGHGYRFVLAGLDRLDVAVGQKLAKGVALGRMPDWSLATQDGRPSLYVQLRHGTQVIDPSGFLRGRS